MTFSLERTQVPAAPMATAAQERTPLSESIRIYRTGGLGSRAGVCTEGLADEVPGSATRKEI